MCESKRERERRRGRGVVSLCLCDESETRMQLVRHRVKRAAAFGCGGRPVRRAQNSSIPSVLKSYIYLDLFLRVGV